MNIYYLREGAMAILKANVNANVELYKSNDPWLGSYFSDAGWHLQSNIHIDSEVELVQPQSPSIHFDFENTKIIYSALKGLSVSQATEERLWAFLCHSTFWKYMRARWPIESYVNNVRLTENVQERYFFMANRDRALIRNGIARLWWYGYVSYDSTRSDPFELTNVLLKNLDIAENLLGRSFSRNRSLTIAVLNILAKLEKAGKPFIDREAFRILMKYINQLGGVTILDALSSDDIEKILVEKMEQLYGS